MRIERYDHAGPADAAFELDPETLQTAEFLQARAFLDTLIGKTVASATTNLDRTSISTTDGMMLVFCRFGGVRSTGARGHPA